LTHKCNDSNAASSAALFEQAEPYFQARELWHFFDFNKMLFAPISDKNSSFWEKIRVLKKGIHHGKRSPLTFSKSAIASVSYELGMR